MQVKKKEAETVFRKLNITRKHSTHHVAGWVEHNGKKMFLVHYSNGRGDMPGKVGLKFMKSLKLKRHEFSEFVACHIDPDEYFELVKNR